MAIETLGADLRRINCLFELVPWRRDGFLPAGRRGVRDVGPSRPWNDRRGDSNNDPYVSARLRPADRGKGIGAEGDGETLTFPLGGSHTYEFINVPAGTESVAVRLNSTQ